MLKAFAYDMEVVSKQSELRAVERGRLGDLGCHRPKRHGCRCRGPKHRKLAFPFPKIRALVISNIL